MEAPASEYLYTLSILAITFAVASALVTAVRQIKGGNLSRVDVHLLTTFLAAGFVICIAAILPSAIALFGLTDRTLWVVVSLAGAAIYGVAIIRTQWERRKLSGMSFGPQTLVSFTGLWVSVAMLVVNAVVPSLQGGALYAGAITLSLATVMWAFVRRIASLGELEAQREWNLDRG